MNLMQNKKPVVWTISGSDSGGGAGIQADLYTFQDFSVHGCSVITALTAQNSFAVGYTIATEKKNVVAQINALDSDMPARAIKVGMLLCDEIVDSVCKYLNDYQGVASGGSLLEGAAGEMIRAKLLPRVDVLTPNAREAESLTGMTMKQPEDMQAIAEELLNLGCRSVVITGGHFADYDDLSLDFWTDGEQSFWLMGEYIDTINDHGSGCTFSSAVAAALAQGYSTADALVLAKAYVTKGLRDAQQIGSGPGPVGHFGWPDNLDDLPAIVETLPVSGVSFEACDVDVQCVPVVCSLAELQSIIEQPELQLLRLNLTGHDHTEALAQEAKALAAEQQVCLIIENDWQLAIAVQAYGVHLAVKELSDEVLQAISAQGLRLGVTVGSYEDIARVLPGHCLRF